jgi:hypothetical protein
LQRIAGLNSQSPSLNGSSQAEKNMPPVVLEKPAGALHAPRAAARDVLFHARWLFGIAAAFNVAVASGLLFGQSWLAPLLGLTPAYGSNALFLDLTAMLIAVFGYAYARVAGHPQRFRPYIALGVLGKTLVVVLVFGHWLLGDIGWQLPLLASADALFSLLFLAFLRRLPA